MNVFGAAIEKVDAAWLRGRSHRLSAIGEPIFYTAMVVTKLEEIPESMLVDA